jgi:hypothetical protein
MRSVAVLALALAALGAVENTNVAPGDPPPVYDETAPLTDRITVRNRQSRAVKIAQIDSTCTCTTLELRPRLIPPDGTATLEVAIDNRNRSGLQEIQVSLFASDPQQDPIEVPLRWSVRPAVTVDAIRPNTDPQQRPDDRAWLDVYKYVARERPDELHRLRKRVRVASDLPGFQVQGVEYAGTLWAFSLQQLRDGVWLVTGKARDPEAQAAETTYDEQVVLRTNHPQKSAIPLTWITVIDANTGRSAVDPLLPQPLPVP